MTHSFYVMPVWADNEGSVVIFMVLGAQAGRAIIHGAGRKGRAIEGFYLLAIISGKRQVEMRRALLGFSTNTQR
ncbi:Uncharacterized protein ChrSV_4034 [Chromobacterium vaccinii]|nr:Uncharacterized protein ChrSW_4034 [Chromobacterium vaccinii]QND91491.1 Uncharacterized protein ChrSV_4034 [Chromobacterium vaccinii]SUX56066.1 Uncharacterised protein [Chromobacterium vaccinii]